MIVDEVEAELGLVQILGEVTDRQPPLSRVPGRGVRAARDAGEVPVGGDRGRRGRVRRRQCGKGAIDHRPGERTERVAIVFPGRKVAHHRLPRSRSRIVGDGEVASDRVDMGLLPGELVEARHRQGIGRRDLRRGHPDGQQRFAQFRARLAELAHVEGVDGGDAVRDEGALPPVEHVLAEAQVDGRVADFERGGDIRVEQPDIAAHALLRLLAQPGAVPLAVPVLEVDEAGGPDERAEPAGLDVEVGGELGDVADNTPVVVEVAVVAVGLAGERPVAVLDPEGHALGDRGIDAPLDLAAAELHRARRRGLQEYAENSGARRQGGRDGDAARMETGLATRRCATAGFGHVFRPPEPSQLPHAAKSVPRDMAKSIFGHSFAMGA